MVTAYVLLRVKPGMDRSVLQSVKKLAEIKDFETVYGEYDLLIKIEVKIMEDLDGFIFDNIRMIRGVEGTTTLIGIKTQSP
jgi:DNA-binding Lrp family transcriptional regulator